MDSSMNKKLKILFDYQSFENNPELVTLKQQAEKYCANALNEEDLAYVNAAGDFEKDSIDCHLCDNG